MLTKKLAILKGFATLLFLLGIIGWFLLFLSWPFGSKIESPNSGPHGIVLDRHGNIYCGSKTYGRIQKYYPDGRFACGFNTGGGTGRGGDFGFQISEKDQLCITVLGVSKRRLRIYDTEGKLIHTEVNDSNDRDYVPRARDSAIDSAGNVYTFSGFLFPRVIKQTPAGKRSTIISTPLLVWLIQGPFPAFAFLFVPAIILKIFGLNTKVTKSSVPVMDRLINRKNLPSVRKIVVLVLCILGIVVLLCILIPVGFKSYPLLVIFGFLSFAITVAVIMLLTFISAILAQWRYARIDFKSWKNSIFARSPQDRYKAVASLRLINDPVGNKMGAFLNKVGLFCFFAWFVILVLAICVVLYLDHVGVWSDLISKYSPK